MWDKVRERKMKVRTKKINDVNKIIVLFKTHLDLGFTDLAENVIRRYIEEYIPNALRVAKEMRGENERFIWTTGSWMIQKYLEVGKEKELMEDAIRHGEIRWHGLPFTTHTELMNQELFQYGLGISGKLDRFFGMKTIAAKLTDVPGHTKAMVPVLYESGIRFLHIGVNPASTRPDVPDLFRWRADSGEEIVVMYNNDYGKMTQIGTSGVYVYFAHTGDNRGPQSGKQIREIYEQLRERYPDAELAAGTLEDVAALAIQEKLPVITEEIGDSWIHGVGSDPGKVSMYRALLRLKEELPKEQMDLMYKELICIPEHTWGLDEKITLGSILENGEVMGEHRYFVRSEFEQARKQEKFRKIEQSWEEQRAYIKRAINNLPLKNRKAAEQVVSEYKRDFEDVSDFQKKPIGKIIEIGEYQIRINEQGAIDFLKKGKEVWADKEHLLGAFFYEVFSQKEYDAFRNAYVTSEESWALEDFGKIGVSEAVEQYSCYKPIQTEVWGKDRTLIIRWKLPKETIHYYGGIEYGEMKIECREEGLYFDFAWQEKKASRIPEAMWIRFCPTKKVKSLQKMGMGIAPHDIIKNGNRRMHAVEAVYFEKMKLEIVDSPLVSLGEMGVLRFSNTYPDLEDGVYINLMNNTWGTNFPMWYDENARFRFRMIF